MTFILTVQSISCQERYGPEFQPLGTAIFWSHNPYNGIIESYFDGVMCHENEYLRGISGFRDRDHERGGIRRFIVYTCCKIGNHEL
jgi:hypothetical protein